MEESFRPRTMIVWNDPKRKEVKRVVACITVNRMKEYLSYRTPIGAYGNPMYEVFFNAEDINPNDL